jgi:hypothetical protein
LTLRGIGEATGGEMKPVTARDLSGIETIEKAPEFKVRVRRAGQLKDETVEEAGGADESPEASN